MSLREFFEDKTVHPETPVERETRAELRLSSFWRVVGMRTVTEKKPYSDSYPDIREPVRSCDLEPTSLGKVYYWISMVPQSTYRCPCCGKLAKAISYHTRELRHVNDKGYECTLYVNIPKLDCKNCGRKPSVRFPAADPKKSYTRELARAVMSSLITKSRTSVAKEFHLKWDVVDSILDDAIEKAMIEQDLSHTTGVYVDETQFGSGQDYITTFLNQKRKVIFICKGHGKDTLELFKNHLIIQGGDPESIRFFSADMSSAYEAGVLEHFPNATLVWDRFHLAKTINETINDIRKELIDKKSEKSLRLVKFTVLYREDNLPRVHKERLRKIRLNNPKMALAYDMKETFLEIIKVPDPESMKRSLLIWLDWVESDGEDLLKKKAARIREKIDRIVAWTKHPVSNSVSEGVNKNIQDIRRQACGFTNIRSFFNMIMLRQGELTFRF